jgi:anti-sigma regulatory factor (Ser/Thr protein kinase)
MRQQGTTGFRGVRAGWCGAWPLPADETCAGAARRLFKDAVAELGLEPSVLDDAVLMTSELAANTLHASEATRTEQLADGCPELWLYLRDVGIGRELVCKVFDCYRGWLHGPPPVAAPPPSQSACGRGLQIVHELSGGRWGHHPTRARLGGWALRGKAVWFAVPAPLAHARLADVTGLRAYTMSADVSAARRNERISARQAARQLEMMLTERGFGGQDGWIARADENEADMSVLSVRRGLTLRCESGKVSLTGPSGCRDQWSYADLVEVTEHTVRSYEELDPVSPGLLITA